MNVKYLSICFSLLLGLVAACGPADIETTSQHQPILNGDRDTSQAHMAVVLVYMNGSMCTGTLIAPRTILTAGHCLDGQSTSSVTVGFGTYTSSWGGGDLDWINSEELKVHPQYDLGGGYSPPKNDVALIRLASDAPRGISLIPHLPHALGVTNADIGSNLEFVGFGQTETGSTGTKMTVTEELDWVCVDNYGCYYGGVRAGQYTIGQDQVPGGICSGDSGGPALIVRNGQEYVAGIASYTDQGCKSFGFSTKADEFESFINEFAGVTGELGDACASDQLCASGHCADGVCCSTACDDQCSACNLSQPGSCLPKAEGAVCPDANLCNGTETCQAGVCLAGAPLNCSNDNPCTAEACDPTTGCLNNPVESGLVCAPANLCQSAATCQNGSCQLGTETDCDDRNVCTQDSCLPDSGCLYQPVSDGTSCGGGLCGQAICSSGECMLTQVDCDDQNPCTNDWCDAELGCVNEPVANEVALPCGECQVCHAALCQPKPGCEIEEPVTCASHGAQPGALALVLLLLSLLALRPTLAFKKQGH